MAVTQNPFIGKSKQKVANVVLSTWKGINTMRSKPLEVANPRTPAQVAQRDKMTSIVRYARQCKQAIDLGFVEQAIRQSQYNAFVGTNIKKFAAAPYKVTDAFEFAKGSLVKPSGVEYAAAGAPEWSVTFSAVIGPGVNPSDYVCIVIWSEADDTCYPYVTDYERQDGSATIDTSMINMDGAKVFVFFVSPDFRKSSDSTLGVEA